jgi:hypothetical protein
VLFSPSSLAIFGYTANFSCFWPGAIYLLLKMGMEQAVAIVTYTM